MKEAVAGGARSPAASRQGALYEPTIVADVKPNMKISCDELFGPAVAVTPFSDIDEAIALANDTNYGLAAGIFTENLEGPGSSPARSSPATCTSTGARSGAPT